MKKKWYYVYILRCCDNSLYTGYTVDIEHRLREHNEGRGSKYVRSRLPAVLVYYEIYPSKESAMAREVELKKLPRKKKLQLIRQY
ncbi:GIY-YIG nuclease family protein [Desulfofalx alkaliphila]|uniref:GIY-YIG nuclease family protein n=1 Tax=Desulfofalx alkaliphila TaxID=105483 RepID=UPI0004E1F067|nr:GIY-YIG nuclease family protein [Desulfofalx alkaliphila]